MRGAAWAVILCAAAGGGCETVNGLVGRAPGGTASTVARSLAPAVPAEGLFVDSVLIERPVGDEALDRTLWQTDTAAVPPEVAALLAENGLRIMVVRGAPPPVLQRLLDSKLDLVGDPVRRTFAGRTEAVVPTATPPDPCEYTVLTDLAGRRTPVSVKQARAGFSVRPEAAADGRVRLTVAPEIQHGERREFLRPTADATQFVMEGGVPTVRHPALGFAVALGPNDHLLIGWPAASANTLGQALFAAEAEGRPRQRVLVVRAGRLGELAPELPSITGLRGRPSIAAEAGKN